MNDTTSEEERKGDEEMGCAESHIILALDIRAGSVSDGMGHRHLRFRL
jgi:hypothetical protein